MNKPTCKVHGMIRPRVMCGHVITGLKYCGFSGDCPHKSVAEMIVERVLSDAAGAQIAAQERVSQQPADKAQEKSNG